MDQQLAEEAKRAMTKQGLQFHLGARVKSIEVRDKLCHVEIEGDKPITANKVLVAVGRRPNTSGIGLENAKVRVDDKGRVPVDDTFQTNIPGIYAIGDIINTPMLAHVAEEEGIACVEGIVTGIGHVNYEAIPAVCYTHPEIAAVGPTEEQLKEAGVAFRKGIFSMRGNGRAHSLAETDGLVKILADAETDRILAGHIIGPRAGELIAEIVTAIEFGASSEDLARTCHAHPTLAEAIKEAALAVDDRAIHA
jgi:dihydrolipoamide dehydrogenase